MTLVEKAAYLKGLAEGVGIDAASGEGRLWSATFDLVSDMAREIEALQENSLDFADALDELGEELSFRLGPSGQAAAPAAVRTEKSTGKGTAGLSPYSLDESLPEEDDAPAPLHPLFPLFDDRDPDEEEDDEEIEYDGVVYDAICPSCGEEISFDEETLKAGSIVCPNCGEELEFDLGDDED